jgi:hypothetical protein
LYVAQEVVEALGHDLKVRGGFPATCNKDGLKDGEYCARCDVWTKEQTTIPGGHIESEWTVIYDANGKVIKEEKTCERCGMQLDVRIPFVDDESQDKDSADVDVDIHDNQVNVGTVNVGCSGIIGMAGILPCAAAIGSVLMIRRRRNDSSEE